MIRLVDLLLEASDSPKAIFMAGPAGSGKSYVSKQIVPQNLQVINVDDTYEELLKAAGIGQKLTQMTPDELSQAAKLMGKAQAATREKYTKALESLQDIVIDGTGGASKPLLKKKADLEALGYKTLMLMIYVSPLVSLERNSQRERSLLPSIVLRTWRDVNKNIDTYKEVFGDNFVLVNNNPKEVDTSFSLDKIQPYFDASSIKSGKTKSPEEIEKSKAEKEQLNKDIEQMVQTLPEFDSIETAKSKINGFLN